MLVFFLHYEMSVGREKSEAEAAIALSAKFPSDDALQNITLIVVIEQFFVTGAKIRF